MSLVLPSRVNIRQSAVDVGTRHNINYIPGLNITFNALDNPATDSVDITVNTSSSLVSSSSNSADNQVVRFDGTTGLIIQKSGVIIDDSDVITAAGYSFDNDSTSKIYVTTGLITFQENTDRYFKIDMGSATSTKTGILTASFTNDRTWTLQDATGTLAFLSDLPSGTFKSIPFYNISGVLDEDPSYLNYDVTSRRMNIGSTGFDSTLHITAKGSDVGLRITTAAGIGAQITNSGSNGVGLLINSSNGEALNLTANNPGTNPTLEIDQGSSQTSDSIQIWLLTDSTSPSFFVDKDNKLMTQGITIPGFSTAGVVTNNSSGVFASTARGNLTDTGTDGITVTGGTNAVIGSGTSIAQHVADSTHNGYLSSTDWSTFNGKQAAGNYITDLTGDVTASGPGSVSAVLATVNGNVGTFGSSTSIPSFTVNGKGIITAASGNVVIAPAGTLSGTTLNSTVVSSSLTSVGTISSGTWNGTTIAIANGGTGQTTASSAFNALSPMTTGGDIIYGGTSGTGTRLANGSSNQVLTSSGGTSPPTWTSIVNSITGTANQVIASASTGGVTLSTPQDIGTASSVTFGNVTDSALTSGSVLFAGTAGLLSQNNSNLFWDITNQRLGVGTSSPNTLLEVQGQSRFYDQAFTYPAGGYTAIRHNPVVTAINEASPNFLGISISPTLTYTTALSVGFATKSVMSLQPTLISGGALASGTDNGNFVVFNMIPTFNGTVGPRTLNQLYGIFCQARTSGGTVTSSAGVRSGLNANGGTFTTASGIQIDTAAVSAGGAITTNIGLSIGNQTVGSTNWSMQIGSAQSYHVGNLMIGNASAPSAQLEIKQAATTGTVNPGILHTAAAHTSLTASTERIDENHNLARTVQWATGALTTQRFVLYQAPTLGFVGGSTVTDTATVAVTGAPISGTNATLTNTHALLIQAGAVSAGTQSYGLTVNAQTGATKNYAAQFIGGNVGIGTATPGKTLDITGTARLSSILTLTPMTSGSILFSVSGDVSQNNSDLFWDNNNGRLGILTSGAPSDTFSISEKFIINSSGVVTKYNNISTVGFGVPALINTIDTTGLTANVASAALKSTVGTSGLFRVNALVVLTTAGSVSSTLPNVQIIYTDAQTSGSVTIDATPVLGAAGIGQTGALTANTAGLTSSGVIIINAKVGTAINYQTVNYASSLAGMTYALHIKLEAL